jgi:hypothetical protein
MIPRRLLPSEEAGAARAKAAGAEVPHLLAPMWIRSYLLMCWRGPRLAKLEQSLRWVCRIEEEDGAVLAHNLNTAVKRLVLGKDWATKRMKALRFRLIGLPGRSGCRGAGPDRLGPSDHPGAGMRTVRMISRSRFRRTLGSAAGHLTGRQCRSLPMHQAPDSRWLQSPRVFLEFRRNHLGPDLLHHRVGDHDRAGRLAGRPLRS